MQINDIPTRNAMLDAIDDALGATSYARFQNAAQTATYAKVPLETPDPFLAAASGQMALDVSPIPESTGTPVTGTAVRVGFYTAKTAGTLVCTFGVNTTGTPDILMADNTITSTDTVQITSLTLTMPAGSPTT
jgi:hypothetical protein